MLICWRAGVSLPNAIQRQRHLRFDFFPDEKGNSPVSKLREAKAFLGEFRRTFNTTGAVLPSGRFLAKAITRFVRDANRPGKFLEAGPGTGAFTGKLISLLQPGDELVLVEINDRFVEILQKRLDTEADWKAKKSQVRLIHGSVEGLDPNERFRGIVCGLPFNNFEPTLVDRIFRSLVDRLEPNGTFSFFEYWAIRGIKAPLVGSAERERLNKVGATIYSYLEQYLECKDRVPLNVPPALVHHLRKPA